MTATEELRRLLDERGVEWEGREDIHTDFTFWCGVHACETGPKPSLAVYHLTPSQAIAATLGAGTCRIDLLNTGDCAGYECSEYIMHCNGCGYEFGHVLYNENGDVWMSEPPNYCPNCGRRVVEVDG